MTPKGYASVGPAGLMRIDCDGEVTGITAIYPRAYVSSYLSLTEGEFADLKALLQDPPKWDTDVSKAPEGKAVLWRGTKQPVVGQREGDSVYLDIFILVVAASVPMSRFSAWCDCLPEDAT